MYAKTYLLKPFSANFHAQMKPCVVFDTSTVFVVIVVVVVVVVNGSYSAAPYSSLDRECITKVKIKHRQSTQKKSKSCKQKQTILL